MKKIIVAVALLLIAAPALAQQDFQALSAEFMQKWQAANSARMAGEYEKSIALFEECLDEKFDSAFLGTIRPGVYLSLGFLYSGYLNRKEEARLNIEKYIELTRAQQTPDVPGMEQMNAANEMMIGSAYRMLGDHENAAASFEKCAELYAAYWSGDSQYKMAEADYSRTVGAVYYYIGVAYKELEKESEAAAAFAKAAAMYESLLSGPHPPDVELMLSYIHHELGDIDKCIEYYLRFLDLSAKAAGGDAFRLDMIKMSRTALARFYFEAGKWKEAVAEADGAVKIAEKLNWKSDLWRSLQTKGNALEELGDDAGALDAYKAAVEVIESRRSGITAGDDRAAFMEQYLGVYRDIIDLLSGMGRAAEALEYLERSKARSFLDMLGGRKLGLRSKEESASLEKQVELEKEIGGLTMAMMSPMQTDPAGGAEKLRGADRRYGELMQNLKAMKPEFKSLVTVAPPDLERIAAGLEDTAAIVEYYPGAESLLIWVVRKSGIRMVSTDTPAKKIDAQVKTLRAKVTRDSAGDAFMANAENLYQILIAPAAELLDGVETLIVVPHGSLHYLPFNMLADGGEFLIDRFAVVTAPSASALEFIAGKSGSAGGRLLALGDPETQLPALPAARAEVAAIGGGFAKPEVYTGSAAAESLIAGGAARGADALHIASHGLFYADKPMFSALALSGGGGSDGFLQTHEIFGLDLAGTNLVTLSACETGLASISGGDELVGLSRAFIYAGAPRVVVSLWSVNDASTGELMKSFYEKMKSSGAAAALRGAQRELKSNPDFAHPFFWAPFQLVGDWK